MTVKILIGLKIQGETTEKFFFVPGFPRDVKRIDFDSRTSAIAQFFKKVLAFLQGLYKSSLTSGDNISSRVIYN
ncbi:hypothetical protein [Nostoc sp.]|uniref:hypothetical protein n=1 Tax=Nostoc sp. TaxID=1180 RepID=UPI0035946101